METRTVQLTKNSIHSLCWSTGVSEKKNYHSTPRKPPTSVSYTSTAGVSVSYFLHNFFLLSLTDGGRCVMPCKVFITDLVGGNTESVCIVSHCICPGY